MRNSSFIVGIVLSLIFFVGSVFVYGSFLKGLLRTIDGVAFVSVSQNGYLEKTFLFAVAIGLIPFVLVLIWKAAPVFLFKRKIFSIFVVLGCLFIAGLVNYLVTISMAQDKKKDFAKRTEKFIPEGSVPLIPYQKVYIEIYLLFGLGVGAVISFFAFREKNSELLPLNFDSSE